MIISTTHLIIDFVAKFCSIYAHTAYRYKKVTSMMVTSRCWWQKRKLATIQSVTNIIRHQNTMSRTHFDGDTNCILMTILCMLMSMSRHQHPKVLAERWWLQHRQSRSELLRLLVKWVNCTPSFIQFRMSSLRSAHFHKNFEILDSSVNIARGYFLLHQKLSMIAPS